MPFYEHVVLARQDIPTAQVDAINEEVTQTVEELGGKVLSDVSNLYMRVGMLCGPWLVQFPSRLGTLDEFIPKLPREQMSDGGEDRLHVLGEPRCVLLSHTLYVFQSHTEGIAWLNPP